MSQLVEQSFYRKDGLQVAKALLGQILVREIDGERYRFKIVETEAYLGPEDKGAHTYGGKRTERTKPIFEMGGITYIYMIYGMYHCLNIVAGPVDVPHCVLIRALEPMGEKEIQFCKKHRVIRSKKLTDLTNGPGKFCKALCIDRSLNALPVTERGPLCIEKGEESVTIVADKRIGIDYAEAYKDKEWRFYIKDNLYVSKFKGGL